MRNLYLLIILFLSMPVLAQEDTLDTKLLNEIVVTGYDANRKLLQTPGAVALLTTQQINAFDETSAVPALNTIPGVRMEQRSPGSYRIAIRGSMLRAPFGVRNIKVYWNNIPFTEPSGSTNFNLLDVINMGKIEVIKGPAGSIYGAGTGGVVNIQSENVRQQKDYVGAEAL
ncbi:MAG: TonB-dependent receptor plug domain-containing protein, partial [Cyclobacteriaceae bacterium]